jgi:hypothetical protein
MHSVGLDTEKLGTKKYQEYANTRNQVKSAIRKAKANMEKKIAKMLRAIPRFFGNMLTPRELAYS